MKRIVFQGDSITDGGRGLTDDLNHIMGHGYVYNIASKLCCENYKKYEIVNKGVGGNRIDDLFSRWENDVLDLKPDIVSVLVGVNDIGKRINISFDSKKYERIYRMLIEMTIEKNAGVKFVLCEPFVVPKKENWSVYDQFKREMINLQKVVEKLAIEYKAIYVPLQAKFDERAVDNDYEYWLWDGVHPTCAGHYIIAKEWLGKCEQIL